MPLVAVGRKEVNREWGDWLNHQWSWDWFVTLTHDNSERALGNGTRTVVGWRASVQRWDRWWEEVESLRVGPGPAYWVRAREPNPWRKGTHFHALVGGVGSEASRRRAWAAWFARGYGLARILPYDPTLGAAHYLAKYVVKELGDVQFSDGLGLLRKEG